MVYHGAGGPTYNLTQYAEICPSTTYNLTFWAMSDGEQSTKNCTLEACFGDDCASVGAIMGSTTTWMGFSRTWSGSVGGNITVGMKTESCPLFLLYDDFSLTVV